MSIALWTILVAALLPYVWIGIAKSSPEFDNRAPREYLARTTGFRKRAMWAQLNSFEAFPAFAAAVLVAHSTGADPLWMNRLALGFVAARVVYGICYVADRPTARSLAWTAGVACTVGLFVVAAQ